MHVRRRFWSEVVLGAMTFVLLVLTLASPDWIEVVFGTDPDGGNGTLEGGIVVALALSTVAISVMVRTEWRRASAAISQPEVDW